MKYLLIAFCLLYNLSIAQNKGLTDDKFIIVLDIQDYYTGNKLSESSSQQLIIAVNKVINNSNANRIIYIKRTHKLLNLSLSYPYIYTSLDSAAMLLDKRINIVNDQIFIKEKSSAFSIKELNDFLKENNAAGIIIMGLLAEQCVYDSLIDGLKLGYKMYVIPEAIIGKTEKRKDEILKTMVSKGIIQLTLDDFI